MGIFHTIDEGFKYLEGFANFEKKSPQVREYSLERMWALLSAKNDPHTSCKTIHIAGSKGKGSTAAYTAGLLQHMGCKVGIYASPHVLDWRERIRSGEGFFPDAVYLDALEEIHDFVEGLDASWSWGRPTTFELLTLCAFVIFRSMALDWVILETGLGGRLDATNVVDPRLCLITNLELEHTEVLGPTLTHIAREKAGIFKPGVPVCSQNQDEEARTVLEERSKELGCPLEWLPFSSVRPAQDSQGTDTDYILSFQGFPEQTIHLAMPGAFQARNLALAAKGLAVLAQKGELQAIPKDIFDLCPLVAEQTKLPGRLDLMAPPRGSILPQVLLDAGHTPNSVGYLVEWVRNWQLMHAPSAPVGILFALAKDKDKDRIVPVMAQLDARFVITRPGTFKDSDPHGLFDTFKNAMAGPSPDIELEPDTEKALEVILAKQSPTQSQPGLVVVCGSFYLCGIAYPVLQRRGYTFRSQK